MPTYLITSCRGRGFNTALGYFMAGLAEQDGIAVLELSFDENGLLIKTSQEVDPGKCTNLSNQMTIWKSLKDTL